MKNILFAFLVLTILGCSNQDDPGDVNTAQYEDIVTILPQGTWRVSFYFNMNTDNTTLFESYEFTFNEDETINIENDLLSEDGTWTYQDNSSTTENNEELLLQFSQSPPFDEISKTWDITAVNTNKVDLKFTEENSGKASFLAFTKI